jgi:hypothetical protein
LNVAAELTGFWFLARKEALQALLQRLHLAERLRGELALAFKSLHEADRVHDSASLAPGVRSESHSVQRTAGGVHQTSKRSDSGWMLVQASTFFGFRSPHWPLTRSFVPSGPSRQSRLSLPSPAAVGRSYDTRLQTADKDLAPTSPLRTP